VEAAPLHFIDELIEVAFDETPTLTKKPGCPDRFTWRGEVYHVVEMLNEWHDYRRRGHLAHNMRAEHLAAAAWRGSWGVGRDYYRVRVDTGQLFDLYYDRAPKHAADRKGGWYLYRELAPGPP
jgi:hypothetical protein